MDFKTLAKKPKRRSKKQEKLRQSVKEIFQLYGAPQLITNEDLPPHFGQTLGPKALDIINVLLIPESYYLTDKDIASISGAKPGWVWKFRNSLRCHQVLTHFEPAMLGLSRNDLMRVALVKGKQGHERFWDRAAEMAGLWSPKLRVDHQLSMESAEQIEQFNTSISSMMESTQYLTGTEGCKGVLQEESGGSQVSEVPAHPDSSFSTGAQAPAKPLDLSNTQDVSRETIVDSVDSQSKLSSTQEPDALSRIQKAFRIK